jgi:hypothetical protein
MAVHGLIGNAAFSPSPAEGVDSGTYLLEAEVLVGLSDPKSF